MAVRIGPNLMVKQVPEKKTPAKKAKPVAGKTKQLTKIGAKRGRPAIPAAQKAAIIDTVLWDMSHNGKSLRKSCVDAGISAGTFLLWRENDEELNERYAQARLDMYDAIADQAMDISDEEFREIEVDEQDEDGNWIKVKRTVAVDTQRSRLRVDTRKWLLSKIAPKQYGDKQVVDNISSDGSMSPKAPTRIELVAKTEVDK